ncbi:MAG TPA: NADH-quinone oxidoreductase subunit K [Candidatus Lokiarchaeia archaeon]|nr:NADH-quinone oxidoreductase subunit K [Candidatus Lokiarchaeia archaeon]
MDYLILSIILLGIGIFGLLSKRNLLKVLISIELITIAASMNFVLLASAQNQSLGQVFLILTFSTDTCITAVVLAVLVIITKKYGTWDLQKLGALMNPEVAEEENLVQLVNEEAPIEKHEGEVGDA